MSARVLIVDDSAVMRALIKRKLGEAGDIEVVGAAQNAAEARQMIKALDPDVVTLDIEMPGMDGLSFLAKIMELRPTPVIIVSGSTGPGAEATARAMQLGAINCYAKSTADRSIADDDGGLLARLVREAAMVKFERSGNPGGRQDTAQKTSHTLARVVGRDAFSTATEPDLIVIGSSTGGVEALHTLLAGFPADCPPTLIVQHINGCFAGAIARSIDRDVAPHVTLAEPNLPLRRGQVLIAPGGDRHLLIGGRGSGLRCALRQGDLISGHRPSVDALFTSVSNAKGRSALGILLTGMGRDGAYGLLAMAQAGSRTIAQDEASCVIFGMPRAAIELGAAQKVLPLDEIASAVFPTSQSAAQAFSAQRGKA